MKKWSRDESGELVVAICGYEFNLRECCKPRGWNRNVFISIQTINLDLKQEIEEVDLKDDLDDEEENTEGDSYCHLR